ncbi:cobalamin-dependent protein, partial [Eubacterium aggregans]|uniref:cobalamin-dependent protein n=1 Tax=Eubacterium aggregans TaxID=81409 RepID=UPI003F3B836B
CVDRLLSQEPLVYGFSCYIWNILYVLELAEILKASSPKCQIILGGPEVSYDASQIFGANPFVDAIVCGEGEETFTQIIQAIDGGTDYKEMTIPGLLVKDCPRQATLQSLSHLEATPFAYTLGIWKPLKDVSSIMKPCEGVPSDAPIVCPPPFLGLAPSP